MSRAVITSILAAGAFFAACVPASAGEPLVPVSLTATSAKADWEALSSLARSGDARAQRRAALMLLDGTAPAPCVRSGCDEEAGAYLKKAARQGDMIALVTLERLRRAGGPSAPSLAEIVAIETERAEEGDPVAAWRLAQRYRDGDGVEPSGTEAIRWLTKVASDENSAYPKTTEAAYRLCEIYSRGDGVAADDAKAQRWCESAAHAGHAGAALVLAQLKRLDG